MCCAKSLQLCPTLHEPMDCSLLGSSAMRFFRQEYWNRFPFHSPEDPPDPRIEPPASPAFLKSPALAYRYFNTSDIYNT